MFGKTRLFQVSFWVVVGWFKLLSAASFGACCSSFSSTLTLFTVVQFFWIVDIVSDCLVFVPGCLSLSSVQVLRMIPAASIV